MPETTYKLSAFRKILALGLITGTLDALAALIINYKINPVLIFRFIASGVFGRAAFAGAEEMVVAGILFHYLIAYLFTAAFYLLYPFSFSLLKNKYIVAIVYGGLAWLIMNLVVVPLSMIGPHHIRVMSIITGVCALIICVGLPVVLVADKKYSESV